MRPTGFAFILGVFVAYAQGALAPHTTVQDPPSDIAVQNLADLQLDADEQAMIEEAIGRHDYARAETILVTEAEQSPKSVRAAKLLSVAGGVFFLDGKYLNAAIAWKKADAIAPL